jgi:predicted amidophosphoribosyltransferase
LAFRLLSLLVPARCIACGAHCAADALLCGGCNTALSSAAAPGPPRIPGVGEAWAAVGHEGVARDLVMALKLRRLIAAADVIAARIADSAPPGLLEGVVVPVPAAGTRLRMRGYDPAEEIARRLADRSGRPYDACLVRGDGPPQVGRTRAERLASAPDIEATRPVPARALLVDDVQTTGATLAACASALRRAGASRVDAVTFARTR